MSYIKGNKLLPHMDLISNEISCTSCIFSQTNFPIYLAREFIENNYNTRYTESYDYIKNLTPIEVNLNEGDIIIFNGRNHFHWRYPKPDNSTYKAILTHYSKTKRNLKEYKEKNFFGCSI